MQALFIILTTVLFSVSVHARDLTETIDHFLTYPSKPQIRELPSSLRTLQVVNAGLGLAGVGLAVGDLFVSNGGAPYWGDNVIMTSIHTYGHDRLITGLQTGRLPHKLLTSFYGKASIFNLLFETQAVARTFYDYSLNSFIESAFNKQGSYKQLESWFFGKIALSVLEGIVIINSANAELSGHQKIYAFISAIHNVVGAYIKWQVYSVASSKR